MAGSKKNRNKKASSSKSAFTPPVETAAVDNDDLLDDLVAQLDAQDSTEKQEASTSAQAVSGGSDEQSKVKKDSRSRFEARKARKAAEQAVNFTKDDAEADARLEAEAKAEEAAIQKVCKDMNLVVHEVNPDGHCLFTAVADQLRILGVLQGSLATYTTTRAAASRFILDHKDDFLPFLPSDEGDDAETSDDTGLMTQAQFEKYCVRLRDTAVWGGEPEILALSRAFNVPIHVIQHGVPPIVVHDPNEGSGTKITDDKRIVRISYHRRMYGLGEHYNSLRPKTLTQQLTSLIP